MKLRIRVACGCLVASVALLASVAVHARPTISDEQASFDSAAAIRVLRTSIDEGLKSDSGMTHTVMRSLQSGTTIPFGAARIRVDFASFLGTRVDDRVCGSLVARYTINGVRTDLATESPVCVDSVGVGKSATLRMRRNGDMLVYHFQGDRGLSVRDGADRQVLAQVTRHKLEQQMAAVEH